MSERLTVHYVEEANNGVMSETLTVDYVGEVYSGLCRSS